MALFESYDRRIDNINAVLKEYVSTVSKKQRLSATLKVSTLIQCVRKHNPSVSKMLAGLTL